MQAGGRVLIVDDDEATVDMLGQVLSGMNVEHCSAADGREALHAVESKVTHRHNLRR